MFSFNVSLPGEDGAAQMALEDFAMFRTLPGAVCFYPSDAVSCERAIELAANYKGITYTSTSRPSTPVIYSNDEIFEIGKGKVCFELYIRLPLNFFFHYSGCEGVC